jgi:glycosyltransferase involved in cell wall biosynthesis
VKASIITVSYNSHETIYRTVKSVKRQTYPDIEYIVVDGGSKDGTVEILEENEKALDNWISEPDEGIYDAMNKGIRMSTGDIIGIINSDDWYEPEAVETAVQIFEHNKNVDLVHGAMDVWREEGDLHARYRPVRYMSPKYATPYHHPTCFVRKDVYRDIGLFDQRFSTAADYDFMLRFLSSEKYAVCVDKVLANFTRGGETTSSARSPYAQLWRVLRKNDYGLLESIQGLAFRALRDLAVFSVNRFSLKGVRRYMRQLAPYHSKE